MSNDNKYAVRDFMQEHYTDERLAELLAHAKDNKLFFQSCCCFIGVPTANHALKGFKDGVDGGWGDECHYYAALRLAGAEDAEQSFVRLGGNEESRRRILIPMIRAEMKRRAKLRDASMISTPETTHEPAAEHTKELGLKLTDTV